jgi:dihydroorotate dehydrogenase electron transfer subunit
MFQGKCRIISNDRVMPTVNLMVVEAPEIASIAQPGQFVMISSAAAACDQASVRLLRRPISLNRVSGNTISLLFAVVGGGTKWLAGRQAGEHIDLLGPLGKGFSLRSERQMLLLAAGGMGIAPLCFLAERALVEGHRVKMLIGARTASLVMPQRLLPPGAETVIATEDGTTGTRGMVTSLLPDYLDQTDQVCICGPLPMYRAIQKNYSGLMQHIPAEVSLEVRMGCGMGFCYACTIKTTSGLKQVCKDGPVFDFNEIIF